MQNHHNIDLIDSLMYASLVDVDDNPYQARVEYDETLIVSLAVSIKELGLLQIPVARKVGERYQLAFGHRRKRAYDMLCREGRNSFSHIPLYIRELTEREMFEISLSENLKRQDLNPIEKATALKRYMDEFKATSVQAAKLFGIPESTIRGTVRLLNLPEADRQSVASGKMSQTKARVILQKPDARPRSTDIQVQVTMPDLRDRLLILIYGTVRSVTDDEIYRKVKTIIDENKQMAQQIDVMNHRQNDVAKLKRKADRGVTHDT